MLTLRLEKQPTSFGFIPFFSMSAKTISKGTLGLRFMQMAARSKHAAITEADAEKAAVKDDGYWQVEKEVRDAWGMRESTPSSVQ